MLTRAEKDEIIQGLRANIEKSRAVFLTNLIGISSNDSVAIRKKVRESDGHLVITKNKLFGIAAKGTNVEPILSNLKGTNAVAFAYSDAPGVAKVLNDASKEFELVELKAGTLGDTVLSAADLKAIANLPSREQMLATLLATFNAPVSAFVRVLDAIKNKDGSGVEAPATETEA